MTTTNPTPATRPCSSEYVSSFVMREGTQVTIRRIRPEDEPLMITFHRTLSDRGVYMRYFMSLSLARRTEHERLLRICLGDYAHEIVLVAEYRDPKTILGVGRLNKLETDREGEVAVVVSDQYQHRGLGTELLRCIIQIAREERLSRLVAEVLRDNITIQTIFKRLGFRLNLRHDRGSVQAVLYL